MLVNTGLVAIPSIDTGGSTRVSNRPIISATLGAYQCQLRSTTMAAGLGASAATWVFRYTGTNLCLIEKVLFDGMGSIGPFAAGSVSHRLFAGRSFSVSATPGTAAVLTGNNCKLRTSYASTAVGQICISATAALAGFTAVEDSQALGAVMGGVSATAGAMIDEGTLFDQYQVGHPHILANNEGLVLRSTVPATGTWDFGVTVKWTEVTASEWA